MYAKIINNETKQCDVGTGTNIDFYKSLGMVDMEVEQAYDGSYYLKGHAPSQPLEELKEKKLDELTAAGHQFDNQLVNNEMIIKSSLGFSINADLRSQNNLRGLIAVGVEPVNFVAADNSVQSLTLEQLNILLNETIKNGENLYKTKWKLRNKILNSSTIEELNSIEFKFSMLDFSQHKDPLRVEWLEYAPRSTLLIIYTLQLRQQTSSSQ